MESEGKVIQIACMQRKGAHNVAKIISRFHGPHIASASNIFVLILILNNKKPIWMHTQYRQLLLAWQEIQAHIISSLYYNLESVANVHRAIIMELKWWGYQPLSLHVHVKWLLCLCKCMYIIETKSAWWLATAPNTVDVQAYFLAFKIQIPFHSL